MCPNNQLCCVTVIGFGFSCACLKIRMKPKNHPIERNIIFQTSMVDIVGFHVSFPRCIWLLWCRIVEYGSLRLEVQICQVDRIMYAAYIHDELTNQQEILNNDDDFPVEHLPKAATIFGLVTLREINMSPEQEPC